MKAHINLDLFKAQQIMQEEPTCEIHVVIDGTPVSPKVIDME